jgi:hypothetical protein
MRSHTTSGGVARARPGRFGDLLLVASRCRRPPRCDLRPERRSRLRDVHTTRSPGSMSSHAGQIRAQPVAMICDTGAVVTPRFPPLRQRPSSATRAARPWKTRGPATYKLHDREDKRKQSNITQTSHRSPKQVVRRSRIRIEHRGLALSFDTSAPLIIVSVGGTLALKSDKTCRSGPQERSPLPANLAARAAATARNPLWRWAPASWYPTVEEDRLSKARSLFDVVEDHDEMRR